MNNASPAGIHLDSVPVQREGFILEKSPCCYFVKDKESGNLVKLNTTSVLIWQVCTGDWTVGEIVEVLQENYPDAAENMEQDVIKTLGSLKQEDVIELRSVQ